MRRVIGLAAIAALALSACGTTNEVRDPGDAGAAANTVSVNAHEYAFDVAGTPTTGFLTVEFSNTGKELHHGIVGRLGEGKTLDDVKAFLQTQQDGPPPDWFDDSPRDVNLVTPGLSSSITFESKDAGTYVLLCFMPAPDGAPHFSKGMVTTFDVAAGTAGKAPKPDATVELTEYTFSVPKVEAGEVTIEFKNAGKENHEFIVVEFAEGKTLGDVDAWFEGGLKGAPPATFIGGTHDFEPGQSVFFTADLDPGTYTLVCGVETEDGKNHADDLGMVTEFTVA